MQDWADMGAGGVSQPGPISCRVGMESYGLIFILIFYPHLLLHLEQTLKILINI